ncbi:NAD(P)H-dependent glycerol-3-phosphate dehydrogenase [Alteriqipengyuania lutimaris]|uniref:Glycerol-3-phosphate dehydrogenase [NAD(P)+] n=1 Tax=Alteriqipengyuania lutimaris TaxID=1538146 RepID=A0A395LR25_9SPHN|nr:NAD(P)H-dependent glycerol-3-phosphate dehydrogenase [Alteriqipengyuania lutimaris]MBB3033920.1 glycerol-3-phosphate dehydrogenase (NAD(P)+) [Alteriqipengyuania lutimaris]RDS77120.1 NAD(P)-dependent glycerol-3-phosphate dehydrogenase [Alteriqipengyuania lutimaris]
MTPEQQSVAVLGGGAWGTALAQMLASDGRDVTMWVLEADVVEDINANHRNARFLPDAQLAPTIRATGLLDEVAGAQVVLAVVPAQHLGSVLAQMPGFSGDLVICAKGIEQATGAIMSDVAAKACPRATLAALSGPTFAHEVAAGLPAAVTLACGGGEDQWERLSPVIARPAFRPYYSDDLIGAEIGGAVKNVLAIACGVVDGLALGQNARNALIARGFAEMVRFGEALGAERATLTGLCGLGDLVLTCSSTSSRNFSLGKAIGEGQSARDLMENRDTVAEGAHTAPVLQKLAHEKAIDMPIVDAVVALLDGAPAQDVVTDLLARPLTTERRPA